MTFFFFLQIILLNIKLLFGILYKRKITRSINAENAVRQGNKANASEGETIISFR